MATKILGLPDGAPLKACFDLIPHHSTTSSLASYPPYEIRAIAGQHRIHMTLGSPQGFAFQGFIINARDVETGELVGEFIDLPSTVQALQCTPGINVSNDSLYKIVPRTRTLIINQLSNTGEY